MSQARHRYDWDRAAAIMALTANCHRDPKTTEPFKPADFNPFAEKAKSDDVLKLSAKHSVSVLASLFVEGAHGRVE